MTVQQQSEPRIAPSEVIRDGVIIQFADGSFIEWRLAADGPTVASFGSPNGWTDHADALAFMNRRDQPEQMTDDDRMIMERLKDALTR